MKEYEGAYKYKITSRSYVIIRLDGKNFSNYTKGLDKPFDVDLSEAMNQTAMALCDEFNCKFAYTQSDEISLVITEIGNLEAEPMFGNNLQKLCSLTASVATAKFNEVWNLQYANGLIDEIKEQNWGTLTKLKFPKQAFFDSRVFVVPNANEVMNHMVWRQQDATRNSVSMAAHALCGHNACMNKSGAEKQDMMMLEKGVNWNDYPVKFKRGVVIYKQYYMKDVDRGDPFERLSAETCATVERSRWAVNHETPIFTQDKDYLLDLLPV